MTPVNYTPDQSQFDRLVAQIKADANSMAWEIPGDGDENDGEAQTSTIIEVDNASYYIDYRLRVWKTNYSARDQFECGMPSQRPEEIEIEVVDIDAMLDDNEIDIDESSKTNLMARLSDVFYKSFKAA